MAHLTESENLRVWDLVGYRVLQLRIDAEAIRVDVWTMHATFEVRFGTPFVLTDANGKKIALDPENSVGLSPMLALVGRELASLTVARAGTPRLVFADGTVLFADSHPAFEAWEVRGSGALEHVGYLASPGGGSPWGKR